MEMLSPEAYPMGLQRWNGEGDKCRSTGRYLLLTACTNDSFTCSDGSCIRIDQRCDQRVNCIDASDENQ